MSAKGAESTSTTVSTWLSTLPPHFDLDQNSTSLPSLSPSNLAAEPCSSLTSTLTTTPTRSQWHKRQAEDQRQPHPTATHTSRKRSWNEHALTHCALEGIEAKMASGQATPNKVRDWIYTSREIRRVHIDADKNKTAHKNCSDRHEYP